MASLDTSLIRRELRAIAVTSHAVSNFLFDALEELEDDPSQFPELKYVHPNFRRLFANVTLRKVTIISGKHNFRIIVAHWDRGDEEDHVDGLYAFPRRRGYSIDWEWVERVLSSR